MNNFRLSFCLAVVIGKVSGHSRMIYTCSWAPDDQHFVTGSRDTKGPTVCTRPCKCKVNEYFRLNFGKFSQRENKESRP